MIEPYALPRQHSDATTILVVGATTATVDGGQGQLGDVAGAGFRLLVAEQPASASAILARERVDVVLLSLPGGANIDVFRELRGRCPDLPVIVLTESCPPAEPDRPAGDGACDALGPRSPARGADIAAASTRRAAESQNRNILALVSADPDALIVSGPDGTVQFVNEAACRLFGLPSAELLGERLAFSIAEGETTEIEIVSGSRNVTAEMRAVPIDWSGEAATLAVIRDITERRLMLDQLHEAQKSDALGRLAGGVAHDFNNLLGIILSTTELLADITEGSDARHLLHQIERAGDRATAITQQLLKFSRKSPARPQHLDLNAMIRDSLQMIKPVVGVDIHLRTDLDEGLGAVHMDPTQAEQVLMNLVLNARDALPGGGTIRVATGLVVAPASGDPALDGTPGHYAALTVQDDGIGMTDDVKERIFEPFFTTKVGGRGTGLGLAAVSGIVAQAGGQVTVDSAPGSGTSITVLVPLTDQPPPLPVASAPAPAPGSGRVLVAEDEQALRDLVVRMLNRAGYEVMQAADGVEALTLAREKPFDLLLTDILMPGMTGYELAAEIRGRWPERAVVFMTGYADADARAGGAAETSRTLTKPFDRATLLHAIGEAITRDTTAATRPRAGSVGRHPIAGPANATFEWSS